MTIREHISLIEAAMTSDVETALRALVDAFVRTGDRITKDDIWEPQPLFYGQEGLQSGVRFWGDWVMPPGEEDDGDYDWKVMTPASRERAASIVADVQKRFPTVKLSFSPSEKYWISLEARPVAKKKRVAK